ncbi:MAG: MFS transporter [Paracoccaceae bacterium]
MTAVVSFAALFLSIFLVQLGSGSLGPLDALAGSARGFTTGEIGLMGSAHFLGFFVGCYLTPRYIGQIGHSRAFAVAAAVGAMGALLHPVLEGPLYWAGLRMMTGMAIAGAYTVIESWLQAKVENANRARVYSSFRVVDLIGQIAAQGLIAVLDPTSYAAYNIVAVFCCLCLLPLTLSRSVPPLTPTAPRLRPMKAARLSPSACFGVVIAGVTGSAFRMVGPVYALETGLSPGEIAIFLAAPLLGGIAAQYPVGWVADMMDRRFVLIGISFAAIACCLGTAWLMDPEARAGLYLAAFLFGATSYPVFSISAAYANDFAPPDFVVELNAALIFFFSVGAMLSPILAAVLIDAYGPPALWLFVAAAHLALILFALYRLGRRGAFSPVQPYAYVPRTSMVLGRLFRSAPGETDPTPDPRAAPTDAPQTETPR